MTAHTCAVTDRLTCDHELFRIDRSYLFREM